MACGGLNQTQEMKFEFYKKRHSSFLAIVVVTLDLKHVIASFFVPYDSDPSQRLQFPGLKR